MCTRCVPAPRSSLCEYTTFQLGEYGLGPSFSSLLGYLGMPHAAPVFFSVDSSIRVHPLFSVGLQSGGYTYTTVHPPLVRLRLQRVQRRRRLIYRSASSLMAGTPSRDRSCRSALGKVPRPPPVVNRRRGGVIDRRPPPGSRYTTSSFSGQSDEAGTTVCVVRWRRCCT